MPAAPPNWLLQDERDGGADEVEGLALFAGGLGEHREGRRGSGEADLVAGQGAQVDEQAAEAVLGAAVLVVLAGGLGVGGCRAAGRATGFGWEGGSSSVWVSGAQAVRGCQVRRAASMQISTWPLTRFSSRWKTGRRSRSSALTCRKSRSTYLRFLVGGDDAGRVEFAVRYGSAQDVDPVESGFLLDLVLPALDGQAVIGNGDLEVLGHLVLADHLADGDADRVRAGEACGRHPGGDRGEELLGGGEQVLPLAGALFGQHRVAAGDQPLAGEARRGDLRGDRGARPGPARDPPARTAPQITGIR